MQHAAGSNLLVQALHELRDRGGEVPPAHVQEINVVRLQLLQRVLEADVQRLAVVAAVVNPDTHGARGVADCELGRENDLVPVFTKTHPFS